MGTFVGSGRHCNGAARDDVGNDLMSGVTGENYIWSFGVVREEGVLRLSAEKKREGSEKEKKCTSRESNPGQTDGNHLFYH